MPSPPLYETSQGGDPSRPKRFLETLPKQIPPRPDRPQIPPRPSCAYQILSGIEFSPSFCVAIDGIKLVHTIAKAYEFKPLYGALRASKYA